MRTPATRAISGTGFLSSGPGSVRLAERLPLLFTQLTLVAGMMFLLLVVAPRLSDTMETVVTYSTWAASMIVGGVAAMLRSRLAEKSTKLRWMLLGVSLCCGAMGYIVAAANNYAAVFHVLDPLLTFSGNAASAAVMLAITVSLTGAPAGMRPLDLAQTALFLLLDYVVNSGSNPWAKDVQSHVVISMLLALMFFVTAALAPLSAATKEERRFFRIVALYLGAAMVGRFISSQIGYLWMHAPGNLYCLPAIGVCVGMALFLMQDVWKASRKPEADRELAMRRLLLRNLMPSLLALTCLLLALYVFLHAPLVGLLAVLSCVLLYLSRTLLLQSHMGREANALRRRNEQLEEISQRDPLTAAGNRRSLAARYERARIDGEAPLSLLLIDLDFFKHANDLLGHLHGDHILQKVAEVLRSSCGAVPGSHVARFGGDEFALLLPQVTAAGAAELAETVRAGVEALEFCAGEYAIAVSIGGVSTAGAESLDELIRSADAALYRAKYRGRNRAEFVFDGAMMAEENAALTLASVA